MSLGDYPVMSENGDWILFTATLSTGEDVLVRVRRAELPVNYCTAGVAATGCAATVTGVGIPSATQGAGLELRTSGLEGGVTGLFFFGSNGRQANPGATARACSA